MMDRHAAPRGSSFALIADGGGYAVYAKRPANCRRGARLLLLGRCGGRSAALRLWVALCTKGGGNGQAR